MVETHDPAGDTKELHGWWTRREAGPLLFLVVSACWVLGFLAAELDWVDFPDLVTLVALILSLASVVLTGYLGRLRDALLVGWVPGVAMIAVGFALTPDPGGDETGGAMIFVGGLVLLGAVVCFFPLIALGVWLRARHTGPVDPVTDRLPQLSD